MKFQDKVAVITGAGQGIGRAVAQRLAGEGATIVALDMQREQLDETLKLVGEGKGVGRICDVSDSAAVDRIFQEIDTLYGHVDILVNNAGIGTSPNDGFGKLLARQAERGAQIARGEPVTVYPDLIIDMADEGFHGVMKVNLYGAFYCMRAAVRLMIAHATKGAIVNISSTSAISGEGALHYAASKSALVGLTRSLARELAPRGIRVNNVMPGPVNTPIMKNVSKEWIDAMIAGVPLGRMAEPADIAAVVAFLASADAAMVTGSDLVANGGSYFK